MAVCFGGAVRVSPGGGVGVGVGLAFVVGGLAVPGGWVVLVRGGGVVGGLLVEGVGPGCEPRVGGGGGKKTGPIFGPL